jgi:hypothetical protein
MCNFKSALVLRDESKKGGFELFLSPWTESHSTLMLMRGIKDGPRINCARVEFSPPDMSTADRVDTYKLRLDEQRAPEWWNQEMAEAVAAKLDAYISSIIVSSDVPILIGGQFILSGGAKIESADACIIQAMLGTSQVGEMRDASKVGEMRDASKVGTMWHTSKVGTMWNTSQVGTMWHTSKVGTMWNTSQVGEMRDASKVGTMWNTSQVGTMWNTSKVGTMWNTSKVGEMRDASKVGNDLRETK